MRKRLIGSQDLDDQAWLDLNRMAQVEMTSEDSAHPIEFALTGEGGGWRASTPGEQVIRLLFDEPVKLRSIEVDFDERTASRTQEFVLRWSQAEGRSSREIVRQQFTFSPPGTTRQTERYAVDIDDLKMLELRVIPDIGGGPALASLSRLRLG